MEGGWGLVVNIVLYGRGYFVVLADTKLSVCGRGTPKAHSLGWGMGGVKSGSKNI